MKLIVIEPFDGYARGAQITSKDDCDKVMKEHPGHVQRVGECAPEPDKPPVTDTDTESGHDAE